MRNIRLIYSSYAREGLVYRDFLTLMETAAASNRALGITGMLCYGGGQFLQALEGERDAVNVLYHHIARDPRHSRCTLLAVEEVKTRDFAEWSMKIIDWSDTTNVSKSRQALLLTHSGLSVFDPDQMTGAQASAFLRATAAAERELLE